MSNGFADFVSHRTCGVRSNCGKTNIFMGQDFEIWDLIGQHHSYNPVTKEGSFDKPDVSNLSGTLGATKIHASTNSVSNIGMPNLVCGLNQLNMQDVVKLLPQIFAYASTLWCKPSGDAR